MYALMSPHRKGQQGNQTPIRKLWERLSCREGSENYWLIWNLGLSGDLHYPFQEFLAALLPQYKQAMVHCLGGRGGQCAAADNPACKACINPGAHSGPHA